MISAFGVQHSYELAKRSTTEWQKMPKWDEVGESRQGYEPGVLSHETGARGKKGSYVITDADWPKSAKKLPRGKLAVAGAGVAATGGYAAKRRKK